MTHSKRTLRMYAAESHIDDPTLFGPDLFDALDPAEHFIMDVIRGDLWKDIGATTDVFVDPGRSVVNDATARRPEDEYDFGRVRISAQSFGPALLLHELAHIGADRGGHGHAFAKVYLRLLEAHMVRPGLDPAIHPGRRAADQLRFGLDRNAYVPLKRDGETWLPAEISDAAWEPAPATAAGRLEEWGRAGPWRIG